MSDVGFDVSQWDHWLLVISFMVIAISGLWLSWQWQQTEHKAQDKSRRSRRLFMELHAPSQVMQHSDTNVLNSRARRSTHSRRYRRFPTRIQ